MKYLVVALVALSLAAPSLAGHGKECKGSKNCTACKTCEACKHCSQKGGTCGVCKAPEKPAPKQTKKPAPKKKK